MDPGVGTDEVPASATFKRTELAWLLERGMKPTARIELLWLLQRGIEPDEAQCSGGAAGRNLGFPIAAKPMLTEPVELSGSGAATGDGPANCGCSKPLGL